MTRALRSLCLLAAVAVIPAVCKPTSTASGDRTEILIGATLPLTGAESRLGGAYKEGYDLAFDEVNQAGGLEVGGKKLRVTLKLYDDTTAQATANNLAEKLINSDRVDFRG